MRAKKAELHGLPYSVSLTLPPMSTVFYEHKPSRGAAASRREGDKTSQAKPGTGRVKKTADAQPAEEKPARRTRAGKADAVEAGDSPNPARKPRAKKADAAGEDQPKPARRTRAKKADNAN